MKDLLGLFFIQKVLKSPSGEILHHFVVIKSTSIRPQYKNYLRHRINDLLQLALRLFTFGHIANDRDAADDFAGSIEERRKVTIQKNLLTCVGESVGNVACYHSFACQRLGVTILTT